MATLDRAVALVEVHGVPVVVAEHLHFDVARVLHELLHQHAIVIKPVTGLAPCSIQLSLEFLFRS